MLIVVSNLVMLNFRANGMVGLFVFLVKFPGKCGQMHICGNENPKTWPGEMWHLELIMGKDLEISE